MPRNSINLDPVDELRYKYDAEYRNQRSDTFNIGTYEYPEGLRVKPDLQHYVAFFINVREKSELGKRYREQGKTFSESTDGQKRRSNLSTEEIGGAQTAILNNAGKLGAVVGLLSNIKKGVGSAVGGALTVGVGARIAAEGIKRLDSDLITSINRTYRLKEVITLHLEERPSVRYGVNYSEKDLGTLTGLLVQGSASQSLSGKFGQEAVSRVIAELIKLPSIVPGGATFADIRELSTRAKTNPFREVLFESVDYRTFNFKYRFYPKNKNESKKIKDIIQLFKLHMHPEISENKFFYVYPSEFEIQYFYKDKENDYFNKFATCALTGLDVEYGGEQFATFEDGAPVEVGLSLTFRELEQVTSQGVEENGY